MYMIRECAACVLVAVLVGMVVIVICGIGYLLKLTVAMIVRAIQAIAYRAPTLKQATISLSNSNVICIGVEPIVVADCPL
jgi:hypothetical protein